MVTHREDGGLIMEGGHLVWEEPAYSAEQQAAHAKGVLPLAALHDGGDLPCLVPLHKHTAKHGEAAQLRVVRVRQHHGVRDDPRRGGGGAAGRPVSTERNHPGLVEWAQHGLVLREKKA